MKPRVTVSVLPDGFFEIHLNEAGRDLLVAELQGLDRRWDHVHLDCSYDPELGDASDVVLSGIPYTPEAKVLCHGKVLFRPDDWDAQYYPHVMAGAADPQV